MLEVLSSVWQFVAGRFLLWIWHRIRPPKPHNVVVADNSPDKPLYVAIVPTRAPVAKSPTDPRGLADLPESRPVHDLSGQAWTNLPHARNEIVTQLSRGIHPGMQEILERAGDTGAHWTEFQGLPWEPPFHPDKLYAAMGLMARRYGFPLQFAGRKEPGKPPARYRIAPGWDHACRIGQRTSPADFAEQR